LLSLSGTPVAAGQLAGDGAGWSGDDDELKLRQGKV